MRSGEIRLAVFKLTSCSGCQEVLIDLGEELLALTERVKVAHFPEASSASIPGPYDVALVEGSVSTPREVDIVKRVREEAGVVIAAGTCAVFGGIQSLRNWSDVEEAKKSVYLNPEWVSALERSEPVSSHIEVDCELSGCPVNGGQLLSALKQIITGRRLSFRLESLCQECKRMGNVCVMVTKQEPCLGPIVREGCGALCPKFGRGCYGCFGPMVDPRGLTLAQRLSELGLPGEEIALAFKGFAGWSEAFKGVIQRYGRRPQV